jgi:hypothetical protein
MSPLVDCLRNERRGEERRGEERRGEVRGGEVRPSGRLPDT